MAGAQGRQEASGSLGAMRTCGARCVRKVGQRDSAKPGQVEEACGGLGLSPLPPPSEREAGPASAALLPSCSGLWPGQALAHQGSGAAAGFPHLGRDTCDQGSVCQ